MTQTTTQPTQKSFIKASRTFLAHPISTLKQKKNDKLQCNKTESFAIDVQQDTILNEFATPYVEQHHEQTGFYPLGDGQAALIARLALIETAQISLDVQYYLFGEDVTSQLMTWYLYQAAERGVKVRLLLDDMQGRNDKHLASLSTHPNIELRLFNPFYNRGFKQLGFLYDFRRVNRRMHNKSIIADGVFSISGGRNIGDEYFGAHADVDFGDFDLLLTGKIIAQMTEQFDCYWNSQPATPIQNLVKKITPPTQEQLTKWNELQNAFLMNSEYAESLFTHPFVQDLASNSLPFYWSNATLNYDSPEKVIGSKEGLLIDELTKAIEQAENEFVLISPYFVPTRRGAYALANAARNGLKVTIITNSLASNDVFAVHGWYSKYRNVLLKGGVKLYETKVESNQKIRRALFKGGRSSLHAKSFIIDNKSVFVGSFNFDPRSMFLNTEMGVFVDSPEFAHLFDDHLEKLLNQTSYRLRLNEQGSIVWHDTFKKTTYHKEPHSSIWLRMGAWFAGVLPIEGLL